MNNIAKVVFIIINILVLSFIGCVIESSDKTSRLTDKLRNNSGEFSHRENQPLATLPSTTSPATSFPTTSAPSKKERKIKPPFTLQQCIEIALKNNPDIGSRHFEVLSAKAQEEIAAGERWPVIKLQSAYKHYFHDQRLVQPRYPGEPGVWDNDMLSGDIVFKMPLFTFGRITNNIKAATLLKQSSQYQLARTREELVFNISQVFYKILAQRYIINSLKFSQKALQAHRKRITDMIEVQRAAKVDLLRTEVRLADIKQRIVAEQNVLSILRKVLVNFLGLRNSNYKMRVKGTLALNAITPDLAKSISIAYMQRADYLAMKKKVNAQRHRLKVAQAGRWPIISLDASYGFRSALNPSTRPASEDQTEDEGFFGVTAEWSVFEGGRIEARIRNERAKLDAAREQLRKLKLQIQLDVETAILNIKSASERLRATETSIAQAKESLRIEREKYAEGKGSITDVLDAQDALLNAQTAYYYALSDYNTAIAQWRLAIGEEK